MSLAGSPGRTRRPGALSETTLGDARFDVSRRAPGSGAMFQPSQPGISAPPVRERAGIRPGLDHARAIRRVDRQGARRCQLRPDVVCQPVSLQVPSAALMTTIRSVPSPGAAMMLLPSGDQRHAMNPLYEMNRPVLRGRRRAAAARSHHELTDSADRDGRVGYHVVFFTIWWPWMNFTWFASAYDTDDVPYRLLTFVQIAGVLVVDAPACRAPSTFGLPASGRRLRRSCASRWSRSGCGRRRTKRDAASRCGSRSASPYRPGAVDRPAAIGRPSDHDVVRAGASPGRPAGAGLGQPRVG